MKQQKKKILSKIIFSILIFIYFSRINLKARNQLETKPAYNFTPWEQVLQNDCHLVKHLSLTLEEFQFKLQHLAVSHQKMMTAFEKATQMKNDFFQYKMKNNINHDDIDKASNLQAKLYRHYQQKFYEAKMQADNYLQKYFYQKDIFLDQVKNIPSHQKDFFRTYLLDFKSTYQNDQTFLKDLNHLEHFLN